MKQGAVIRSLVLGIISLWAIGWLLFIIASPNPDGSIFGWNLSSDGQTIAYVMPGGPAERAGIRVGDRVHWADMPLVVRSNLGFTESAPPGARAALTFFRGGKAHRTTIVSTPWANPVQQSFRWSIAVGLVLIAIGIVLVHLRPSRMTWSFLLTFLTFGALGGTDFFAQSNPVRYVAANGVWAILTGVAAASVIIFMSRFPADRPRGVLAIFDRAAIPLGALTAGIWLFLDFDVLYAGSAPPAWALVAYQYGIPLFFPLAALAALVIAYATSSGSDRHRIVPVLCAFAAFIASAAGVTVYSQLYTDVTGATVTGAISNAAMLALALAVANGVIRHRVVDISFVVSRTVVYTLLTSLIVGAFVLIDFVSSKVLDRLQLAIVLEAGAALAFGFSLNALHSRIDRFIDSVLFRRRHIAEQHLERAGKTLGHAESTAFIDEVLVAEACDALALASAAVFHRTGNGDFTRVQSVGWDESHSTLILHDDHLAVTLLAELEPIDIAAIRRTHANMPAGLAQPLLAIPFAVRHEMLGFALYGGHVGGEAIDPDERRTLVHLAAAAAAAYEHVRARAVSAEATELRAENALLTREGRLLREMVEALRSVTEGSR